MFFVSLPRSLSLEPTFTRTLLLRLQQDMSERTVGLRTGP